MPAERKLRVLLAKMGLDAHDTGITVVSSYLRDAGMEVVYGGIYNTPDKIAAMAEQEDVDLIGLSFLTREHLSNIKRLKDLLKVKGIDIPIVVGGIVPDEDIEKLKGMGVREVFVPGASRNDIVNSIRLILGTPL
jgi:methylmalonyl-CoA mutase, C-terminal domain